ncbi:MAG: hypothetical protein JWM90_878 [Thermoleophilia bacterium]|nr:hypothetical protein [Thermoleophilia bacterium]
MQRWEILCTCVGDWISTCYMDDALTDSVAFSSVDSPNAA